MFAASPSWQRPDIHKQEPLRPVHFDLRDRVKPYAADSIFVSVDSPCTNETSLSPTDAFFGGPSPFVDQIIARKATRTKKHCQGVVVQLEPERSQKPQKPPEHRPSLADLQAPTSPVAKELTDRIVSNSDRIYGDALISLSTSHKELAKTIVETTTEDDRIVSLLRPDSKRTIKPPAETRITDERTGDEIQVGQRIADGRKQIDSLEVEVASLWKEWETAQKDVNEVKTELSAQDGQMRSMMGVQQSLAGEMAKFEAELTAILEDAHEEARSTERGFSKKIKGVMSALLQQYFLED